MPTFPRNRNHRDLGRKEMPRAKGKFWPRVRAMIWAKAQQLFQDQECKTMGDDFKGITAEQKELREAGYFQEAKVLVLRGIYREKKGLPPEEADGYVDGQ